jgi:hypothetical protein
LLWDYQQTPGEPAADPRVWPASSKLTPPVDRALLLQFIHPRCPCSKATLTELKGLLARINNAPEVHLLFIQPRDVEEDWARSSNWELAHEIPDAQISIDRDGEEARRFGVQTSGQTLIYGSNGALLFSGGLTLARGEIGESPGGIRAQAVLEGADPDSRQSAVFGCGLRDPQAQDRR